MTFEDPAADAAAKPTSNEIVWRIGWRPTSVILGLTLLGGIIGVLADAPIVFLVTGLLIGVVTWYRGVQEINQNYTPYVQQFLSHTERAAERDTQASRGDTYSFLHSTGKSPPLIEPSDRYFATTITLTDTSANVRQEAEYDLTTREQVGQGRNYELFYDQISAVETYQDSGRQSTIELRTADTERITVSSAESEQVRQAASTLRSHVREAKA